MRTVKCSECGKIINSNDAISMIINKRKYSFCNEEEKNDFINRQGDDKIKKDCYSIVFDICKRSIPVIYGRFKELNNKYSWKEIYEALEEIRPSIEKYYSEKHTTDFALARYIETCINNTYDKETEKVEKCKFHIIRSKKLAMGISYILEEDYYEFDDKFKDGWKCYSFRETERFKKVLESIDNLKEEFKIDN